MSSTFVDRLNHDYLGLHTAKEEAFWAAYMGHLDDPKAARATLGDREIELQRWLQDPSKLEAVRSALPSAASDDAVALRGWLDTFAAHTIDRADAREVAENCVRLEGDLANARGGLELRYTDETGIQVKASSVKLGTLVQTAPQEAVRKSAWEALRAIEPYVLDHGFLEVVRERNKLGRMLGGEDYYDWKVRRVERMSKAEIFGLLDELERLTRDAARRTLEELKARHGDLATHPWNLRYLIGGDVSRLEDPYFGFAESLRRWAKSFAALGVRFRGALLSLDLLDRKGKYENGFMHGPEPAWRDHGAFRRARINFTANAIPGMVGSGLRATQTFFHEGGHAAHFANIDMPAPCFGQEHAPTSVAWAEIQSMFMDSFLGDADWRTRYATDASGGAMPFDLIERSIRASQPGAAIIVRAMLAICYGERAIYELADRDLTPANVLAALREAERKLLFLDEGSPRPVLSVPHLLSGESSAYYHGYVLADMGVRQTRAFFQKRDGHLCDNPRIGPDLTTYFWRPGNSKPLNELLRGLVGEQLSPQALAHDVNRTADEAIAEAKARVAKLPSIPPYTGPIDLDAEIRIVHGREEICRLAAGDAKGFDRFADAFAGWIAGEAAKQG